MFGRFYTVVFKKGFSVLAAALLGLAFSLSAEAKDKDYFAESDPQFEDYQTLIGLIFEGYETFGTCSLHEVQFEDKDLPEPVYRGHCEIPDHPSFCLMDGVQNRCFKGRAEGISFGTKIDRKKGKASIRWEDFFYEGEKQPTVLLLFKYKFKLEEDGWRISSKKHLLVFDLPKNKKKPKEEDQN